jgi:hypothetical protein
MRTRRQRQGGQPGPVNGIDRNRPPAEAPGGFYRDTMRGRYF